MNKLLRIISAIISLVLISCVCASCTSEEPPTEAEIIPIAKSLIENAVEVNRIFFWEGLPHVDPAEDALSGGDAEYLTLTEDYMYLSEPDLMEKAKAVYSEKYCSDIKTVAFEGIKVSEDEALFARYIVEQGIMKINLKLSEEGLSERLPNVDTLEIEDISARSVTVSLEFTCEGVSDRQNVTLIKENNSWKIDSPTY